MHTEGAPRRQQFHVALAMQYVNSAEPHGGYSKGCCVKLQSPSLIGLLASVDVKAAKAHSYSDLFRVAMCAVGLPGSREKRYSCHCEVLIIYTGLI